MDMLTNYQFTRLLQRNVLQASMLFVAFFFLPAAVHAQLFPKSKIGKGIRYLAADSSFAVKMNVRFQTLYAGELDYSSNEYTDIFLTRRSRLKFEGFAVDPSLEFKVELGLSNRDIGESAILGEFNEAPNIILDAVLRWEFTPGWSVWFGQTKLPGNRERVISSQKLQFVDRSLLNSRYNIDRDAGLQLHHVHNIGQLILREAVAISLGEGRNFTEANRGGYNYTGRIEVLPFGDFEGEGDYVGADLEREETPKLSVGLTYDYNDGASRLGGQLGRFFIAEERDLTAFFADAMFKYQGLSIMSEYAIKETEGLPVFQELNADGVLVDRFFQTGKGFNLQAGYLFPSNYEIAGRYTSINPEIELNRPDLRQYTLGLSKYIAGHTIKVQTDASYLTANGEQSEFMYRFQVEMGF